MMAGPAQVIPGQVIPPGQAGFVYPQPPRMDDTGTDPRRAQ
jgi:hypothetical protein